MPSNSSVNSAYVLALSGEADRAFAWLDKAMRYSDTGLTQIANQPEFTNIHDDPRWLPFLESNGMSPECTSSKHMAPFDLFPKRYFSARTFSSLAC
jgi:hypothetical protein